MYNGVIIDVPDNFFASAFFSIGLLYGLGKAYNRYLLEEIAFERRRYEERERKLLLVPSLDEDDDESTTIRNDDVTEYDLRRMESARWLSVYGRKYRGEGKGGGAGYDENDDDGVDRGGKRRRTRTGVLDRDVENDDDDDDDDDARRSSPSSRMSDDEILDFEKRYGISYDPYYDEPYDESELPTNVKYKVDRSYGDRRYEDGEVFYKEGNAYYRQGGRPRQRKFWDMNAS